MKVVKYKKRAVRRYARRRVYKKRRYPLIKTNMYKTIGPPKAMRCKLQFITYRTVNVAASAFDSKSLSINNIGTAGQQPLYFDQYSTMYQRYRVYGMRVLVKAAVATSTSNLFMPTLVICPYIGNPSWGYDIDVIASQKGSVMKIMTPAQGQTYFKHYYSVATVAGVTKRTVAEDDQYAAKTSGAAADVKPLQECNVGVYLQNRDGTASITYTLEIQQVFYVKFFQNVNPAAS